VPKTRAGVVAPKIRDQQGEAELGGRKMSAKGSPWWPEWDGRTPPCGLDIFRVW